MAENNNNNNQNIGIINGSVSRYGVTALAGIKSGIGFGLKHTGSGIVWLGRQLQDTGVSLQTSAIKDRFAAKMSDIMTNQQISDDQAKAQLDALTADTLKKIQEMTEGVAEQIQNYSKGKVGILSGLNDAKAQVEAAQKSAFDLIAEILDESDKTEEPEVVIEEQAPAPKPKKQPKQTNNRNFDEEAFVDC